MAVHLSDPWLVAAWPGMGGVALLAGTYLLEKLGALPVAQVLPDAYFDVQQVKVKDGLVLPAELPRSTLYAWKDPAGRRDLVIFTSDAQPGGQGYAFCEELLGTAQELGVRRIVTFAAMATPSHPLSAPRVFGVATHASVREELRGLRVELLTEGEISGLNGVLLAAGAARGIPGACLLGEFPYFASTVPNPKPASSVLRTFMQLSQVELDLSEIDEQAEVVEDRLLELLERLQRSPDPPVVNPPPDPWSQPDPLAGAAEALVQPLDDPEARAALEDEDEPDDDEPDDEALERDERRRIDALFDAARGDRDKALELKAELDRRGLFKRYEDRFLDLFRCSE
ncbi:MAG: PAC2 family protein [Planctomycetes bacterium]|nr:PAC2 family protein [Planctomycetota bacterium]